MRIISNLEEESKDQRAPEKLNGLTFNNSIGIEQHKYPLERLVISSID